MQPLILPYQGEYAREQAWPAVHARAFVAPGAAVIGDVTVAEDAGIWFGCVIRGDVNRIRIGARTNIQDGTMIHVTRNTGPTTIGAGVTIGHACLLHACTLEDDCFIGMRSTLMDDVVVERGGWVAAGALVTPGKRIPSGQIWAGSPAKYFRDLTEEEQKHIPVSADNYVRLAREYMMLKQAE
jgi:carbonic anhydrase/acetyltransferase-like protein (isoleucine patch superfamily)